MGLRRVFEGTDDEHEFDAELLTMVDETNIGQEFLKQASTYVWYATLYAQARVRRERAKYLLDVAEASLDGQLRKEAAVTNVKLTEGAIQKSIVTLGTYQTAMSAFLSARNDELILEAVVTALAQRKDMLMGYGSLIRQEMSSGLSILEKGVASRYKEADVDQKVKERIGKVGLKGCQSV